MKRCIDGRSDIQLLIDYGIRRDEVGENPEYPLVTEAEWRVRNAFREQLRKEIDWEYVDHSLYVEYDKYGAQAYVGRYYYGQLSNPSGKYYTPWANSNVTPLEAYIDSLWFDALEDLADENGYSLESGEGDATDLFFVKTVLEIGDKVKTTTPYVITEFEPGHFADKTTIHIPAGFEAEVSRFDDGYGYNIILIHEESGEEMWLSYDQVEKIAEEA